ncbi:hypothetical protein E2562_030728, partial [Oryza meyeriana var. granulata]
ISGKGVPGSEVRKCGLIISNVCADSSHHHHTMSVLHTLCWLQCCLWSGAGVEEREAEEQYGKGWWMAGARDLILVGQKEQGVVGALRRVLWSSGSAREGIGGSLYHGK